MTFATSLTSKLDTVKTFGVRLRVVSINVPVWYSNGMMMVNRSCLEPDHPEHTYNWIIRTFDGLVDPEKFGVRKPVFRKRTGDWLVDPMDPRW